MNNSIEDIIKIAIDNATKELNDELNKLRKEKNEMRNGDKEELLLGPYVGAPTDHTVIPFGKGICGQVAVSNENFVVPDVSAQDNYIACNINVKAEIVIPIFVDGKNIGQIDIDSNRSDPFTKNDVLFLEFVCDKVSEILL